MLTPAKDRLAATRDRRRRGVRIARVEYKAVDAEYLVVNGYLPPDDADNQVAVGRAISALLSDLAAE